MPRKSAELEEVIQRLDEDFLTELRQFPSQVKRWFTSNVIQRALAYLAAFTEEGKARTLKCTADGKLKVVAAGAGFTDYTVKKGTAADDYTADNTFEFSSGYSRWDILIEDNDAIASFKKENAVWGDDITLKVGYHSVDFSAVGIKIKNRTASYNAKYEIVAYR